MRTRPNLALPLPPPSPLLLLMLLSSSSSPFRDRRRNHNNSSIVHVLVLGDGDGGDVVGGDGGSGRRRPCLTESDLNFVNCDLDDLDDGALADICGRIGLDMTSHVLPFLSDDDIDIDIDEGVVSTSSSSSSTAAGGRTYDHADYVRGAEECLLVEYEMDRLEMDDPDYLEELEREALRDDPTIVSEVIANVLDEDVELLRTISSRLREDAPHEVKEMEGMMEEGEELENRPDVVAFIIAKMLSDEQNLDLLDEFDEALSWTYGHRRREGEGEGGESVDFDVDVDARETVDGEGDEL